ncbi:MAG TPA: tail fiber domain-containing protein, partial [Longimicrobium sp.]|nr:tail fiber domain-containing protein [Longimicrobium sp.]
GPQGEAGPAGPQGPQGPQGPAGEGLPSNGSFVANADGGFAVRSQRGIGSVPTTGDGDRLMWHPFKSAFRAGEAANGSMDDVNIGFFSWGGGQAFRASGAYSFAYGNDAVATGLHAMAMGNNVTASGNYSWAMGRSASTNGLHGAFVWSDGTSATTELVANAPNSFSIRASGGVRLFTNSAMTAGVTLAAGGSSWAVVSDRNRKEAFLAVDGEDVLARVRSIPVTTWRYLDEEDRAVRHIGPMAQDWNRAFGFSGDPLTINMSDFDGVNFAAVQALEQRTAQLDGRVAEVERLNAEVAALRDENAELRARLERIEALLKP